MASDQYAALHAAYRWDVPAAFNIGEACCGRWASDRARFALYWEDESGECAAYTFWDLEQRANRLANALTALGVGRGDRVALILPQRMETVVAHIAVYRLGAVAVPLSFLFGPEALAFRLQNSRARVAFVDPQSLPNVVAARGECPDLTAVIGVAGARETGVTPFATLQERAASRFTPVATVAADPALLVYTSRTTAIRAKAISSGRPPTGRGPAASWTRCCPRSILASRSSAIAAASTPSARSR
jgi:acetyl-CoA synthetase